jgi:hypothetical protein
MVFTQQFGLIFGKLWDSKLQAQQPARELVSVLFASP